MVSHGLLDDLIMHVQQPQHAGLVRPHLAAEAHDVGKHDRRELADPHLTSALASALFLGENSSRLCKEMLSKLSNQTLTSTRVGGVWQCSSLANPGGSDSSPPKRHKQVVIEPKAVGETHFLARVPEG